jgi:exosortase family protein XrtG
VDIAIVATLATVWSLAVLFFRLNRIWLPYYIVGSVGLAFLFIYIGRNTPIEPALQTAVAQGVHAAAQLFNVPTETFDAAPGALLVLVISQEIGWTMLQVTVESSGLLESGVVFGMLMFYPAWGLRKRGMYVVIALLLTYGINIVRLMVIVATLHLLGKDSLLVSHTIIGRAVFFIGVIAIYWYVLSRPTLGAVRKKLDDELVAS